MTNTDGLDITDKALDRVNALADKEDIKDQGLRIMIKGGGCSGFTYDMDFDQKNPGDMVFERNGLSIFIDPMSFQFVTGTRIDYVETFQFAGFQFENPNATQTCGCGSSFAV